MVAEALAFVTVYGRVRVHEQGAPLSAKVPLTVPSVVGEMRSRSTLLAPAATDSGGFSDVTSSRRGSSAVNVSMVIAYGMGLVTTTESKRSLSQAPISPKFTGDGAAVGCGLMIVTTTVSTAVHPAESVRMTS
jgi:hypothetical protein